MGLMMGEDVDSYCDSELQSLPDGLLHRMKPIWCLLLQSLAHDQYSLPRASHSPTTKTSTGWGIPLLTPVLLE